MKKLLLLLALPPLLIACGVISLSQQFYLAPSLQSSISSQGPDHNTASDQRITEQIHDQFTVYFGKPSLIPTLTISTHSPESTLVISKKHPCVMQDSLYSPVLWGSSELVLRHTQRCPANIEYELVVSVISAKNTPHITSETIYYTLKQAKSIIMIDGI